MVLKKQLILLGCMCLSLASFNATQGQERHYSELFPVGKKLAPDAFHMGIGVSKMWGAFGGLREFTWQSGDSAYFSSNNIKGGLGLHLEGGYSRYYKDNPLMDNLDISLAFNQRTGKQNHEGVLAIQRAVDDVDSISFEGEGYFDNTSLALSFTGSQHLQITNKKFYNFGYGFDVNYRVFNTSFYDYDYRLQRHQMPGKFMANFHLRMGYGFYWRNMVLMNPAITIPVISTNGVGSVQYLASGYLPMILSVRFTWLKKPKSDDCPAIQPTSREKVKKRYYLQELFHPDDRKNVRPDSGSDDSN